MRKTNPLNLNRLKIVPESLKVEISTHHYEISGNFGIYFGKYNNLLETILILRENKICNVFLILYIPFTFNKYRP